MQWNLDRADTLSRGHLNVAETFCKSGFNHNQIIIRKPAYSGHFRADASI